MSCPCAFNITNPPSWYVNRESNWSDKVTFVKSLSIILNLPWYFTTPSFPIVPKLSGVTLSFVTCGLGYAGTISLWAGYSLSLIVDEVVAWLFTTPILGLVVSYWTSNSQVNCFPLISLMLLVAVQVTVGPPAVSLFGATTPLLVISTSPSLITNFLNVNLESNWSLNTNLVNSGWSVTLIVPLYLYTPLLGIKSPTSNPSLCFATLVGG